MDYDESEMLPQNVINTVIENSRDDFLQANISEAVLEILQSVWERKLSEKNVIPSRPADYSKPLAGNSDKQKYPRGKRSQKGSATKLCQFPCSQLFLKIEPNVVCNRDMPLLTIEEEEEYKPILQPTRILESIPKPKKEEIIEHEPEKIKTVNEDTKSITNQASPRPKNITIRERLRKCILLVKPKKKFKAPMLHSEEYVDEDTNNVIKKELNNSSVRKRSLRSCSQLTRPSKKLKEQEIVIEPNNNNNKVLPKRKRGHCRKYPSLNEPSSKLPSVCTSIINQASPEQKNITVRNKKIRKCFRSVKPKMKFKEPILHSEEYIDEDTNNVIKKELNNSSARKRTLISYSQLTRLSKKHKEQEIVIEPNNNNNQVLPKRKRGRPRKYPLLNEPSSKLPLGSINIIEPKNNNNQVLPKRKRGRPRKYPLLNEPSTNDSQYQNRTVVQIDGVPSNPKFNVKPKYSNFPMKGNHINVDDETELNTDDDLTDSENVTKLFECNNIIHCQYDMVKRRRNKWKIDLKCGVMHLKGKDYAFNSANCKVIW